MLLQFIHVTVLIFVNILGAMIKLIIISLFAIALVLFAVRFFPTLRFQIQRLLQKPFVRAILFRRLWRLISQQ